MKYFELLKQFAVTDHMTLSKQQSHFNRQLYETAKRTLLANATLESNDHLHIRPYNKFATCISTELRHEIA